MKKIYLLVCALFAGSLPLLAQQEATLHSMQSLPQNHYINPAFTPQQQFYLGLPGISSTYLSVTNSGFNYSSLVSVNPETDSLYIDLIGLQKGLGKKNYLNLSAQTDVLSLGLKVNARMYLFLSSTLKVHNQLMYPEGMTGLLINGNGAYLGETVAFSPEVEHLSYLENAIGASYTVDKKLTVGARFKLLKGVANIQTAQSDFTLTTDADTYALNLKGTLQIQTAGAYDLIEGNIELVDFQNYSYSDLQNNGFAVDLGATYQLSNRLMLGFSALNLGSIKWKHDTREYYLQGAEITFRGLNVKDLANGGSGTAELEQELEEAFRPQDRPMDSYHSGLPGQFYLSARYELARNLNASGLLFAQSFNGNINTAFSATLNKDFGRRIGASLSYTAANRSFSNLGAGFSFRLTPIQFYFVSDNIISSPIFYRSAKALSLRAGLNLMFGYRKGPSKPPYDN
ncbi:DUF5723 family protein [Nafulsella turpanensis]|uniref:DUF5723 family protein n=1 Tax=Nafulsella turpanensis TaxID=1265690 RepID=UPI000348073B|nr:DUF5723 family protein [Nafulsella turpanensis]